MKGISNVSFGAGPFPQGVVIDPDDQSMQDNPGLYAARYLQRIAERYDLPRYRDSIQLNLTAQGGQLGVVYRQVPPNVVNAFTLTVVSGTIGVWLGDQQPSPPTLPDFQVLAGSTIQVFLPPAPWDFTLASLNATAATGVFIRMAV